MNNQTLDLEEEIIEELAFEPRIDASDIGISARDGIITLRGTVPNFNQKWEAEEAVKRVRGVRGIANELEIDLPAFHVRSDADIAASIARRLESNSAVPQGIQCVVKDGRVTLTGRVTWYYQAVEAGYEARRVTGVKNVENAIAVDSGRVLDPQDVKKKIEAELQRSAVLDAKHIDVAVSGNTVTLTGAVRTWLERDKAAQTAWNLPGVTRVENFILVNP